jgi:hypothetical protein
MLAIFDFEDTVDELFRQHGACRQRNLEDLSGKTIYFNLCNITQIFLESSTPTKIQCKIENIMTTLRSFNINAKIIDRGLDNLDRNKLVEYMSMLNVLRNRFYYLKMISSFLIKISKLDERVFYENSQFSVIDKAQSFRSFAYCFVYANELAVSLKNLGYTVLRAPQSHVNQLLRYLEESPNNLVFGGILGFLISSTNSIIQEFDFEKKICSEYDFELLADRMNLSPCMLRKCLFGSLMYFLCHSSTRNKIKFIDAFIEDPNNFGTVYTKIKCQKQNILLEQISFLASRFSHARIDASFIEDICEFYGFQQQEITDLCGYFFNNLVMTNNHQVIPFPGNSEFTSTRYIIDDINPDLLRNFYYGEVTEEILFYLTKFNNHTHILFYPNFDFPEFAYVSTKYCVRNVEKILNKYLELFPPGKKEKKKFYFQFFDKQTTELEISDKYAKHFVPKYVSDKPATFFNVLFNFYESLRNESEFLSIQQLENPNYMDLLHYVTLVLFHKLGYINIQSKEMMIPAAALAKTNPENTSEEIIMLFEIIKNNLLMEQVVVNNVSIYKDYGTFMKNNIFDEALDMECIYTFFIGKSKENDMAKGIKNSEGIENSNSKSQTFSESSNVSELLNVNSETIKVSLMKSLEIFYRTIKEFQSNYQNFTGFETSSVRAELILEKSFENNILKSLVIGSRIFCFVKTDFYIPDLFAMDFSQFQRIIFSVQQSLRNIVDCSKIEFQMLSQQPPYDTLNIQKTCQLPFHKDYCVDGGKLFKIIASKFLIYETLVDENDLFTKIFANNISPKSMADKYGVTFSILEFLSLGKTITNQLSDFLMNVQAMAGPDIYQEIIGHLFELSKLLSRIIHYYQNLD